MARGERHGLQTHIRGPQEPFLAHNSNVAFAPYQRTSGRRASTGIRRDEGSPVNAASRTSLLPSLAANVLTVSYPVFTSISPLVVFHLPGWIHQRRQGAQGGEEGDDGDTDHRRFLSTASAVPTQHLQGQRISAEARRHFPSKPAGSRGIAWSRTPIVRAQKVLKSPTPLEIRNQIKLTHLHRQVPPSARTRLLEVVRAAVTALRQKDQVTTRAASSSEPPQSAIVAPLPTSGIPSPPIHTAT